jgi:hypothetical protein
VSAAVRRWEDKVQEFIASIDADRTLTPNEYHEVMMELSSQAEVSADAIKSHPDFN